MLNAISAFTASFALADLIWTNHPSRKAKWTSAEKILVIGGAGLTGSHTVDALLKEDVSEVVVYDNFVRGRMENSHSRQTHVSRFTI